MSNEQIADDKIPNAELRKLARTDATDPVSVLIELDLPQPNVQIERVNRGGVTINLPSRVEALAPEQHELIENRVAEAGAFLKDVLQTSPRWLSSAHSFVARVNSEQLRLIANSPLVKAIWPNRDLHSYAARSAR